MIGKTLGHYKVAERIGAGGMGVVYKARDLHLDRFVALKILPPEKVADPDRKRRFVQEAKAASALNHPNIVHVYDIDQSEGADYIAMEYVEGKTLDQRIGHRGLPLNDALNYAVQIADALAKAHSTGIVHRDLKPTNIMVNEDGVVKVLDFGLAKLTEQIQGDETASAATVDDEGRPITEEGVIVGTVAYMSPEQAEGKRVDARSDIFSLGSLLYEMVTGHKAFQGTSTMSTLSAILHQEPKPVSGIRPEVPAELERLIARCLRKDPAKRFQHTDDVKVALDELKEESDFGKASPSAPAVQRRSHGLLVAAASLAVLLLAAGGWLYLSRIRGPAQPLEAVPLTSYPGLEIDPTFSPDGNAVAFSWNGENQDNYDIYVKLIGPGSPLRLTRDPAEDRSPAWSPDGQWIAFLRISTTGQSVLFLIPALGGAERKICDVAVPSFPAGVYAHFLAWSRDGAWLAVAGFTGDAAGLALVSPGTGQKRSLMKGDGDLAPAFAPDGHALAFVRATDVGVSNVYLQPLSAALEPLGEPRQLTFDKDWAMSPAWTPDGRGIVFSRGSLAVRRSLWRIDTTANARPEALPFGQDASEVAISGLARRLVYTRAAVDFNIWRLDRVTGRPPRNFISSTLAELYPQFSPDGSQIAFASNRSGNGEIWLCDKEGSNARQLTAFGRGATLAPAWSPDGQQIAFESRAEGWGDIYTIPANGGTPKRMTTDLENHEHPSWSRDGKWIYFGSTSGGRWQVWKMPAEGGTAVQITHRGGWRSLQSPDRRFLYYSKRLRQADLWKLPLDLTGDPAGEETRVLDSLYNGASYALWQEGICFIPRPPPGAKASIQMLLFASGKVQSLVELEKQPMEGITVSPDGRSTLWSQIDRLDSDLVLVENFR